MNDSVLVRIQRLHHAEDLPLPQYHTAGSSGMDLLAAVEKPFVLEQGRVGLVPTGLRVELSPGYEFQVRPRSGLALRHGIAVLNSPGTIDADYRGEIKIILANLGQEDFTIERGLRIAQMVLCRVEKAKWALVDELNSTQRGAGGFGHTGKN
mgnify:CR=1 FL=1